MKQRTVAIERAIIEINKPYPQDNIIICYQDFLKVRDYIHYYKFNPKVLQSLLDLTCELWESNLRISRVSLIATIKRHGFFKDDYRGRNNPNNIDLNARRKVFLLFQYYFEKQQYLSETQIEKQTIIDDFESQIEHDKYMFFESEDELMARFIVQRDLGEIFVPDNQFNNVLRERFATSNIFNLSPEVKLSKRYFDAISGWHRNDRREYDFEQLHGFFYSNIDRI